jgi:phospholipid/cholesterol/gamma-HCH transport system substrate-binding protein
MSMRRQLERHGRWLIAIGILVVAAGASGGYILSQERLRTPFLTRYYIHAEFSTSTGLNPGMGQPVNVAGVRVGTIATAELHGGRSVLELEIDPAELPHVYRNARVMLIPNTPLKDMQVELSPGGPPAHVLADGGTLPMSQTTPPIDSDELTAILDADTRDYFQLLLSGFDEGTRGRGQDLHDLFLALGPTAHQAAELGKVLAGRKDQLQSLVHSLSSLAQVTGGRREQLISLVQGADKTLAAVGSQDAALRSALADLPRTIEDTRSVLANAKGFSDQLPETLNRLMPVARKMPDALRAAKPLVTDSERLVRTQIRPFTREAQPLARKVIPAVGNLSDATPSLTRAFQVLGYVVNELGYNPPGDDEGFLFWLAWVAHNSASLFSTEDAHGAAARGFLIVGCDTLRLDPTVSALFDAVAGTALGC